MAQFMQNNSTALKNSEKLVYNQVYLLLPIIICVFLITAISVISVNAITVRRQLKNYAIYNICGLSWKKCCLINLLSSIIMCLIAIIMMVISVVLTKYISFFSQTVIDFGIIQVFILRISYSRLFDFGDDNAYNSNEE